MGNSLSVLHITDLWLGSTGVPPTLPAPAKMKGMIGEHFHSSVAVPHDPLLPLVTSLLGLGQIERDLFEEYHSSVYFPTSYNPMIYRKSTESLSYNSSIDANKCN